MVMGLGRRLKLYLDTSIPNFMFAEDDKEKQEITKELFQKVSQGGYGFYISGVVIREIEKAPPSKRRKLLEIVEDFDTLEITDDVEKLAQAYMKAGAVPEKSSEDARHVAIATIHNLDAVVSWNFKHLVNLRRVKLINLVNEEMGYKHIEIISPQEVVEQ